MSLVLAIVLVVGAYIASGRHITNPGIVNAESTDAILKAYAAKDTDSDGLPDWEEALYGTDPNNPHSVRADLTDSQAVAQGLATPRYNGQTATKNKTGSSITVSQIPGPTPASGSLTEQFSILFYNNYVTTRGDAPPTSDQMQTFVQGAVEELLKTRIRADAFSASDLTVSGSGSEALKIYVIAAEQAFKKYPSQTPYGASTYFADAVERNDATAIDNLKKIAATYSGIAKALAAVPVPKEAAAAHLTLANAMARVAATDDDLASVSDDPIRGMLGLGSYDADSTAFTNAIVAMGNLFTASGITFNPGDPGYGFFKTATSLSDAAGGAGASTQTP